MRVKKETGYKLNKVKEAAKIALKQKARNTFNSFVEELDKLLVLINVVLPAVLIKCDLKPLEALVVSCIVLLAISYLKDVRRVLRGVSEEGLPVPPKKLVQEDNAGFIFINEEDKIEAIQYLYRVHKRLQEQGVKLNE